MQQSNVISLPGARTRAEHVAATTEEQITELVALFRITLCSVKTPTALVHVVIEALSRVVASGYLKRCPVTAGSLSALANRLR
jgi:hypothetical protein